MKAQIKSILTCIILLLMVSSCDKDETEGTLTLTVASETVLKAIVPNQEESEHMVITGDSRQTIYLPIGSIENFVYEKGFEYKLLVRKRNLKNPPQDSGSAIYTLIEILSKEKKNTLPPEPESFYPEWDTFIDNSPEDRTDIFIGTQYIGVQNWNLIANAPYIYVGATFPKDAFATSFDREFKGNKHPIDLTFNFKHPTNYITGMETISGIEYLKNIKKALNSEEYKNYTFPTKPYIAKVADLKSLSNLESCFPEYKDLGKTLETIAKQKLEMKNVKSLSIGKIIIKGFTVSMDVPPAGLFIETPDNISELVYIREITYGVTAYFIIASENSYQDVLKTFKFDGYQTLKNKSQIILLTVSDLNQNAIIKSSFDDLTEFLKTPFSNKETYGYPIFCKGLYAKDNMTFNIEK
ncbi:DUF4377 domain-containing protein [Bacteroides reticulotermitis]|uniref:DUF4377 domain-containing protein n=1 Tax=Bacteroides reticulotermitis TaxID=1133319 RepID=UPI003A8A72CA